MHQRIAIIGAGVSGLAAALRLTEAGKEVVVFEKSRGLSGRAATRSNEGCRYDFGANYFKVRCNEVARLIFETLPTEGLQRIVGDILTFDREGRISPPDPDHKSGARWTYRDGISALGKLMAAKGGFVVENSVRILRLRREESHWLPEDEEGRRFGRFDAVLITPPAPQTADLLAASDLPASLRDALTLDLRGAAYWSQFSVVLNFGGEICLPGEAYALLNTDREHDLAWVSLENRKNDRIPPGQSLVVAQLSPLWTEANYDLAPDAVVAHATKCLGALLQADLPTPAWSDCQRWRYAHPRIGVPQERLKQGGSMGLYFAGDALIGRGRVDEAIRTGFAAARSILGMNE